MSLSICIYSEQISCWYPDLDFPCLRLMHWPFGAYILFFPKYWSKCPIKLLSNCKGIERNENGDKSFKIFMSMGRRPCVQLTMYQQACLIRGRDFISFCLWILVSPIKWKVGLCYHKIPQPSTVTIIVTHTEHLLSLVEISSVEPNSNSLHRVRAGASFPRSRSNKMYVNSSPCYQPPQLQNRRFASSPDLEIHLFGPAK